jgi:hypothetical protein
MGGGASSRLLSAWTPLAKGRRGRIGCLLGADGQAVKWPDLNTLSEPMTRCGQRRPTLNLKASPE